MTTPKGRAPTSSHPVLRIEDARENNLKGVSVEIPLRGITVVTGPSGSGKSSLVFGTLFAEARWRFCHLAPFFLPAPRRPEVGRITGLSHALSFAHNEEHPKTKATAYRGSAQRGSAQKSGAQKARAHSVALDTGLCFFIDSLIEARGVAVCPHCRTPRAEKGPALANGALVTVLCHLSGPGVLAKALALGFTRAIVDGERVRIEELSELELSELELSELVVIVDTFRYDEQKHFRLEESVTLAKTHGRAEVLSGEQSTAERCAGCGREFGVTEEEEASCPVYTVCPVCAGAGVVQVFVPELLVPVPEWRLEQIAAAPGGEEEFGVPWSEVSKGKEGDEGTSRAGVVYAELSPEEQGAFLFGASGERRVFGELDPGGLVFHLRQKGKADGKAGEKTRIKGQAGRLRQLSTEVECHGCSGTGSTLPTRALYRGRTKGELLTLTLAELASEISEEAHSFQREVDALSRMNLLGLGHLRLNRPTSTLSSSERMRLRFASHPLGLPLLLLFDEPSIGLSEGELAEFLSLIKTSVKQGSTVVIVDHSPLVVREADLIIELGPGGGVHGGEIVTVTPRGVSAGKKTEKKIEKKTERKAQTRPARTEHRALRADEAARVLSLSGISHNGVQITSLAIPLERFTVVTGPSGSGKTTVIRDCLQAPLEALLRKRALGGRCEFTPGEVAFYGVGSVSGWEEIDTVARLTKVQTRGVVASLVTPYLRELYAVVPAAKLRGYTPSTFTGRSEPCEECAGRGRDGVGSCAVCAGSGVSGVLDEVRYKGVSFREAFRLTVAEAERTFQHIRHLHRGLKTVCEVGLGYLVLGQQVGSLSLGEKQRFELTRVLLQRRKKMVFLFEELSRGLGEGELEAVLTVVRSLTEKGHTVVAEECHPAVIERADCVLRLG